jgi:hypothetical protein
MGVGRVMIKTYETDKGAASNRNQKIQMARSDKAATASTLALKR